MPSRTADSGARFGGLAGQVLHVQVLEDAAGAAHGRRKLFVPDAPDFDGLFLQGRADALGQPQRAGEDAAVLVPLEYALAVGEFALRVVRLPRDAVLEIAHADHVLMHRIPVGARVAVDGAADRARDAFEGVQPAEPLHDREVDERLQRRARLGLDQSVLDRDAAAHVAQHAAAVAVVGDDQVRALSEEAVRDLILLAYAARRRPAPAAPRRWRRTRPGRRFRIACAAPAARARARSGHRSYSARLTEWLSESTPHCRASHALRYANAALFRVPKGRNSVPSQPQEEQRPRLVSSPQIGLRGVRKGADDRARAGAWRRLRALRAAAT